MNNSHLAAPYRKHFSATARLMLKKNLIKPTETHLDYGCGRGGDTEKLRSLGYSSARFDPYYFPNTPKCADVVTMSYVLNVIADPQERREALLNAWKLAKKRLIVSSNVRGGGIDKGQFTPLGTFKKSSPKSSPSINTEDLEKTFRNWEIDEESAQMKSQMHSSGF